MAEPRTTSHIKAMREELYARISSQRVLCVDSNRSFRDFVCWFVSDVGCEVFAAPKGGDAIALIERSPTQYDLLILADWLPDMDGVELLRQLQTMGYSGRVVVTTTQELRSKQHRMYESLGVSSIMLTPIVYGELMRRLMRILDQIADSGKGSGRNKHAFRRSSVASA